MSFNYLHVLKFKDVTVEVLLKLLEWRLDNIVYRIGFANSICQARQMVNWHHISVMGFSFLLGWKMVNKYVLCNYNIKCTFVSKNTE